MKQQDFEKILKNLFFKINATVFEKLCVLIYEGEKIVRMEVKYEEKIVSVCLTAMLVGGLSMTSIQEARAAEGKVIDGSVLTHDEESIGYDTKSTRA